MIWELMGAEAAFDLLYGGNFPLMNMAGGEGQAELLLITFSMCILYVIHYSSQISYWILLYNYVLVQERNLLVQSEVELLTDSVYQHQYSNRKVILIPVE